MILEGRHMWNFGWGEEPREGTWQANIDGTSFRPSIYTWGELAALSPDGRTAVFGLNYELRREEIPGGPERTLYTAGHFETVSAPRYSRDGTKLIFFHGGESTGEIDTINADGTDLKTVVSGLSSGWRSRPDISPDGTKIVYTAGQNTLLVANADGSEAEEISTGLEYITAPRFSPGGTKIVFSGASETTEGEITGEPQVFVINTNGTELKQITFDEFVYRPEWSSTGGRIFYTAYKEAEEEQVYSSKADGTGDEKQFEPGFTYSRNAAFSPGGLNDDEYLGLAYAPILRFGVAEKWRPLSVDAFMREEDPENEGHSYNTLCTENGCEELGSGWELEMAASETDEGPRDIRMGRQAPGTYPEPTSPIAECHAEVVIELWDCDTGPRTAIYYHVIPSASAEETTEVGYNYVDYWMFYRYNKMATIDDHQGDWEGLTVAPSVLEPGALDFAIFAQHKNNYVFLPETLECDGGGTGSCGEAEAPHGRRVWDYVAEGSHASYPEADPGEEEQPCTQHASELPEGCHGGEEPWGANDESKNVLPLPPSGEGKWTDWPGKWGQDTGTILPIPVGESPESPGRQTRYKCPWQWYEGDPTACPSTAKASQASAPETVASTCGNWFGGSIVAIVCSPNVLRSAVHNAALGRKGTVHIDLGYRAGRTGSRTGVAQASGAPLRSGESVAVRGMAPAATVLLVRAQAAGHLTEAAFNHLGLGHGGHGVVKALSTPGGVRLVWAGPDGQSVAPTKTRTARMARRARKPHAARHQAHTASSHSTVQSGTKPSAAAQHAAQVSLRACQRTAASDRRALSALNGVVGRERNRLPLRATVHALHEKLANRKC